MILQLLLPILGTLVGYAVFHLAQFLYYDFTSPLRGMTGPKSPSFLLGNFKQMVDDALLTDKWRRNFGPNFVFKGLFNVRELYTSDTKAISHIVTRSAVYQKPPINRILSAELEDHKRQNPAFGRAQVREMSGVFVEKAAKLRDIWDARITDANNTPTIEVLFLKWNSLGFNYQFHGLDGKPNDLNEVFSQLFNSPMSQRDNAFRLVQAMIPILRLIPLPKSQLFHTARSKMFSIGHELVEQSKLASSKDATGERRRDLLSLLLKANIAEDVPKHQRLSDEEVIGQIPTFFIAGHKTTSSAIAWALHALSVNLEAQTKLREELLTVSSDSPTMDELNSLVYLEWVVRETMRVHSPVVFTARMAMEDDVLPLGKPYVDRNGEIHNSLPIRKGQMIHIPILAVNTDPETWGQDAAEFKPERWEKVPDAAKTIPGVWANLLTFFAGLHNCIGFRFSLVEQKSVLFTLIRAFEFEKAVPEGGIGRSSTPLQRPVVLADGSKTGQMPLVVKRYRRL
ncbi:cytochrome P450 [Mycena capillaripes]|nr:cytochrome P450 [Mycena capillaripes]